tara:strand:- start:6398 stop:8803 length:2406 start_codon:yes stop_codon:yes gene_type:complete
MRIYFLLVFLCCVLNTNGEEKFTISGYITDKNNGETIIGANVFCADLKVGVTTNTYGFYSLTLPEGNYEISFSFIGYQTEKKFFQLKSNIKHDVEFELSSINVNEVIVSAEKNIIEKTQTSMVDIPIKQIKNIPALFGEVDVLKVIQLLPGVQSSEGSSGFYVRGGGPDQNLILLDGVPVYNASHIGGLFSVFNADAIKNVRLYKGGFPARFGGRLSSVVQIDMKEGNMKKYKLDASIGLISSKLTIEGPLIKDRTSFIISGRRTYIDTFLKPFLPSGTDFKFYFYDLNVKVNHKISNRDRIFLSAYTGDDVFRIGQDFSDEGKSTSSNDNFNFDLGYGNITSTLRWNHLFSKKTFSNTTFTYSRYAFNTDLGFLSINSTDAGNEEFNIDYGFLSGIEDLGVRMDFDYTPNPYHEVKYGTSYTYHNFFPGEVENNSYFNSPDTNINFNIDTVFNSSPKINAHELFFYFEDNVKINNRLKANLGIHIGYYSIANNSSDINSSFFDKIKNQNNYSFQPRLSLRYLLNEDLSLKASYAKMQQNIHLLTNSSVGLPSDKWVPAIDSVPSQISEQWAANISTEIYSGKYELSLEGYYKKMYNLITYKAGYSTLESTDAWEDAIETDGEGESYGLELFLQRKKGKTTGWIGYTLSWSNRKFDNLNFGEWYPYKYDRRHDFSFVGSHKFNDKWDFGATWVYGTGNAITFPQAVYLGMPNNYWNQVSIVESYGNRNETRMPAYHRLDFSINKHKKYKRFTSTFTVGAYNIYNRKNPFFAYLDYDNNNNRVAKQVSLFPIIPAISYRIKF